MNLVVLYGTKYKKWRIQQCVIPLCVSEPPGPPRKLEVDEVGKSSCALTWKAPEFDGGSPITGYYVERKQVSQRSS